jgi:SHS2 domain-containing protein
METKNLSGYEELQHTADWALKVWAPDLVELFCQAATGMQKLMGIQVSGLQRERRTIQCSAGDIESLLVEFLNEILYWIEMDGIAFDYFAFDIDGCSLFGYCEGTDIREIAKEIKAVTFHRLEVIQRDNNFETVIVFDV